MIIKPKIDILPEAQKRLWPYLQDIPKYFVLYGGTAIALRYGHRQSVDFDFFTSKQNIDLEKIGNSLAFMSKFDYDIHNISGNHVDFALRIDNINVKITLLNNRDIIAGSVHSPDIVYDNRINIASSIDLMACKILALHNRTEAKDFVDVAELIANGVSLQKGIEAAYAIAKISRLGSKQLMIDRLQEEFKSKSVESIIASSGETYIADLAKKSSDILREHAQHIDLSKITKTKLKAYQCIERQSGYELGV